jgi:hypothetical protein
MVRSAQGSELFREKKEDVEARVFQIVFSQNEGVVRKNDPDVIYEWASHQMKDFAGNISNLACDACQKPFKSATFTLRAQTVAVIECKHCNKKLHKDHWEIEKLQMHKCPLAKKANDIVMFIRAKGSVDKQEWMKELNKFCLAFQKKPTLGSTASMRSSIAVVPSFQMSSSPSASPNFSSYMMSNTPGSPSLNETNNNNTSVTNNFRFNVPNIGLP